MCHSADISHVPANATSMVEDRAWGRGHSGKENRASSVISEIVQQQIRCGSNICKLQVVSETCNNLGRNLIRFYAILYTNVTFDQKDIVEWHYFYVAVYLLLQKYCKISWQSFKSILFTAIVCAYTGKMSFNSFLSLCSVWPRVKNVFEHDIINKSRDEFPQAERELPWTMRMEWQPAPSLQCVQNKHDVTSKIWRYNSAKWNTPTTVVRSPTYCCSNILLSLHVFFTMEVYELGVRSSRQGLALCEIVGTTLMFS